MIGIGFQVDQARGFFFDRPRVLAVMDRRSRFVLGRYGGYVRRVARNSLRKKKGTSPPGRPPFSHGEQTLKRFLFYAYDPSRRSVVVGPAKTNQVFFDGDGQPVRGTVPEVLEESGEIRIFEIRRFGRWRRADLRSRRRIAAMAPEDKRFRTVRIAARPFMEPAAEAGQKKLPGFWSEAARRAAG